VETVHRQSRRHMSELIIWPCPISADHSRASNSHHISFTFSHMWLVLSVHLRVLFTASVCGRNSSTVSVLPGDFFLRGNILLAIAWIMRLSGTFYRYVTFTFSGIFPREVPTSLSGHTLDVVCGFRGASASKVICAYLQLEGNKILECMHYFQANCIKYGGWVWVKLTVI
jgi:hypothetical protein